MKTVEKYQIHMEEPLGKGAFGTVYKAVDTEKKIDVAVKIVDIADINLDEVSIKLMKQETASLFSIRNSTNPNLVKTYEILRSATKFYIAMELCEGGDLDSYIKKKYKSPGKNISGQVPEEECRQLYGDIVNGYRGLRELKVVHRDLKPKNILMSKGVWKIADFGFAKKVDTTKSLSLSTVVGTPLYAAPQILNEAKAYTDKCDIWSLGIMIYESLYGIFPWTGMTQRQLLEAIQTQKLKFPSKPEVSQELKDLISKMLIEDEKKRISWEELLAFNWGGRPDFNADDFDEGDTRLHSVLYDALLAKGAELFSPRLQKTPLKV